MLAFAKLTPRLTPNQLVQPHRIESTDPDSLGIFQPNRLVLQEAQQQSMR